jgi:dephospho-CoA kinase
VWVVSVDPGIQEERLKKRNHLSETEIRERIDAQLPLAFKEGKADRVIYNNYGVNEIRMEIRQILSDLGVLNCAND